ncbi:hypothetical protein [Undibacterium sp. WLX3042]|uniref:hypothetical protein n=1 Tax=Undibacterium sp. WLX3042 TaxID=3412686 RepID=UPI003C2E49CB
MRCPSGLPAYAIRGDARILQYINQVTRMNKLLSVLVLSLAFPMISAAQTPVFKCEVDGRVVWSDSPCKGKGKVVQVKSVASSEKKKNGEAAEAPPSARR